MVSCVVPKVIIETQKNLLLSFFILQTYVIGPRMSLFGPDLGDDWVKFNNFRVYGTVQTILIIII